MSRKGVILALAGALAVQSMAGPLAAAERLVGQRPDLASDEGGLWDVSDRTERKARESGDIDNDPALSAYVKGVICKVSGPYCGDIRLYVMDRPFYNAQMAPNGYSEVWSGLMLRASNESELAFALSHETTHFVENHSLQALRAERTRHNVTFALQVGVAVIGAAAASGAADYNSAQSIMDATRNLIDVLYLGELAAYLRYSREEESEADMKGQQRAMAAGYDPRSAVAMWEYMIGEANASDFEKVRKAQSRTSIFDDHPLNAERRDALKAALAANPGGDLGTERYRAAIRPHLSRWLRDELRRRDYGETLFLINHLAEGGEDQGLLRFYTGECYRLRNRPGDIALAAAAYKEAVAQPDAPEAAWREYGSALLKAGQKPEAKTAFETYLAKAPQAEDAWLVREDIKGL